MKFWLSHKEACPEYFLKIWRGTESAHQKHVLGRAISGLFQDGPLNNAYLYSPMLHVFHFVNLIVDQMDYLIDARVEHLRHLVTVIIRVVQCTRYGTRHTMVS
jgi:hypothetical protein